MLDFSWVLPSAFKIHAPNAIGQLIEVARMDHHNPRPVLCAHNSYLQIKNMDQ